LVNILHGVPQDALYSAVEAFTAEHGLQDSVQAFKKGALVAQKPHDFDTINELTTEDKEALRYEVDHKWRQTGPLYFTGKSTRKFSERGLIPQSWSAPLEQLVKGGIKQAQMERVSSPVHILSPWTDCQICPSLLNLELPRLTVSQVVTAMNGKSVSSILLPTSLLLLLASGVGLPGRN
jgi:hypothetical protein